MRPDRDPEASTKLCTFIGLAEITLDVKYLSFTIVEIAEVLVEAKESRGACVRVVLDKSE